MAKPPFKYKQKLAPIRPEVELIGTGDVVAMYSDVFVVVNEADTGLGSLYFYQRQLSDRNVALGTLETSNVSVVAAQAKCVGRVLLSQAGIEKLLQALAENRGFTLARKPEKEQK